ncbi:MAG: DUF882 domain-containing protein [Pseudomonadota bacterium]
MRRAIIVAFFLCSIPLAARADMPASRYFHSGNGKIFIASAKNGASFKGAYRRSDGSYDEAAMRAISRVFGARYGDPLSAISPRLIEFLGYLEAELKPGARITVSSGFRSPEYNTKLRESGKLAAKASLHQYGMAADMKIEGVSSESIWNFVKELGFGGAGFYHGGLVHVDVGPARSWDERTSGVGTDISEENKLIAVVTDKDIYLPGETVELRFTRMTAFPIGVSPEFVLERVEDGGAKKTASFKPSWSFSPPCDCACPKFSGIDHLMGIKWQLPGDIHPGRYRIRARFCEKQSEEMPSEIATPEFEVQKAP